MEFLHNFCNKILETMTSDLIKPFLLFFAGLHTILHSEQILN